MTLLRGPLAIWHISSVLVTGIDAALAATTAGAPNRACVVPGSIAWDECECGTLAVSPQRFFVSDEFPEGALGRGLVRTSPCDQPWLVAELFVQLIRCAPTTSELGVAPTCVDLAAAAQVLLVDAYTVLTETLRIMCELRENDETVDYVIGEQVTRGPEGLCVGTELNVFVGIMR